MKFKYFLRGLGTGIIFCSIIMLVAYMTSGNKLSDKEIMERAEMLGMVKEEDVAILSKENTSEDKMDITTDDEISTAGVTTENDSTELTEVTTEVTTEADKKPSTDGVDISSKITVVSGMTSTDVALLLQNSGIIEDYLDFDKYLNDNGYSTQIKINDYNFTNQMTYEELAKELIKEDKIQ